MERRTRLAQDTSQKEIENLKAQHAQEKKKLEKRADQLEARTKQLEAQTKQLKTRTKELENENASLQAQVSKAQSQAPAKLSWENLANRVVHSEDREVAALGVETEEQKDGDKEK